MIGGLRRLGTSSRQLGWPGAVLGFFILLAGIRHLSWRYHTSAAFEYPYVFSLFTLLWLSAATFLLALWTTASRRGRSRSHVDVFLRVLPSAPLGYSVVAVVARTVLLSAIHKYTQCSVAGIHAFLPSAVIAVEATNLTRVSKYGPLSQEEPAEVHLDDVHLDDRGESKPDENRDGERPGAPRGLFNRHTVVSLGYGLLAHRLLALAERPVGAICPSHNRENLLVPAGQIAMLGFDAVVVAQAARWRRRGDDPKTGSNLSWASLAVLSLLSALSLASVAIVASMMRSSTSLGDLLHWAPAVETLIRRDLVVDSFVAAATLLSALALLASVQDVTMMAVIVAAGVLFHYIKLVREERGIVVVPSLGGEAEGFLGVAIIVLLFFMIFPEGRLRQAPNVGVRTWVDRSWFAVCYFSFATVLLLSLYSQKSTSGPTALATLIGRGRTASQLWIERAGQSKSLSEAVQQYRSRYGMLPPPHFDKWYEFAIAHNSAIIDTFDQIHDDLLPFWGLAPAELRRRTTHLVEQTRAGFGGFTIRNHTIRLSPLTPGSHAWMMDGYRGMVEPYLEWLPDMDLAFNIDDESRVVVPLTDIQGLNKKGCDARGRVPLAHATTSFSSSLEPPWTERHLEEGFHDAHKDDPLTLYISFRHKVYSIFDDYIAPTCPPYSPALHLRWWSRKECLPQGRGVVEDVTASMDVCQRPDIARMHGALLDPAILGVSRELLPVFSQSRISGYTDILVPSPWNFQDKTKLDEAAGRPWTEKTNSVFWRGSSTDGASRTGTWTSFLRARFVHMAQLAFRRSRITATRDMVRGRTKSVTADNAVAQHLVVNVSFVGEFYKGDPPDKASQTTAFYGRGGSPPPGLDFQEHWRHRHLVDLDGAAFSGRFIPFLQSRSLPYRAALFRTWYEERVHAWQHYVPLDVSLNNLWGLVEQMESMRADAVATQGKGDGGETAVVSMGQKIAADGREWAQRALRKEDMQIYMFRLLLEWARVVDDNRENLGFSMP